MPSGTRAGLTPRTTVVPGVGWQAYLLDSEGSPFAIFELDPNAR